MAAGNRHLAYKEALNGIETRSPGSKADFYFGFLRSAADVFQTAADDGAAAPGAAKYTPPNDDPPAAG